MKTVLSTIAALLLVFALATSTAAQDNMVTLTFRLTVQGQPCPNATYWGFFGAPNTDDVNYVQLTDPDGDGVFTGTGTHAAGRLVVQIIQGTGTRTITGGPLLGEQVLVVPGEPTQVIRDFGIQQPDQPDFIVPHLVINQDMTFEASVAGCPAGLPDTGISDSLPLAPFASAVLLLAGGVYLRRRLWQHA